MTESSNLHRAIMLACGQGAARLFRNNTGMGWAGNMQRLDGGAVLVQNARPLHAGLCEGSSDLIGWRTIKVTPDMVGRVLAVFAAIEAKTGRGRLTDAQARFIEAVIRAGGIAGMATTVQDAQYLLGTGNEK